MMMLAACFVAPALAAKNADEEKSFTDSTRLAGLTETESSNRSNSGKYIEELAGKPMNMSNCDLAPIYGLIDKYRCHGMMDIVPCERAEYYKKGEYEQIRQGQMYQDIDTGLIYSAARDGIATSNNSNYPHILLYGAWTVEDTIAKYQDMGVPITGRRVRADDMVINKCFVKFRIDGKSSGDNTVERFYSKYVPMKLAGLKKGMAIKFKRDPVKKCNSEHAHELKELEADETYKCEICLKECPTGTPIYGCTDCADMYGDMFPTCTACFTGKGTTQLISNRAFMRKGQLPLLCEARADLPSRCVYIHDAIYERSEGKSHWRHSSKAKGICLDMVKTVIPLREIMDGSKKTDNTRRASAHNESPPPAGCCGFWSSLFGSKK